MTDAKTTCLVILDDEANILSACARLFRNESFAVFTTTDPNEALRVIESQDIKVVLSDQRMPVLSGVEFLKRVKEKKPGVIRILFTGHTDIQSAEDAINKGEVYRFINKPWQDEDLRVVIRDAMHRYDLTEENRKLFELTQKQNKELQIANARLNMLIEKEKAFTSTASHELRTPLSSIKMAVDLIAAGNDGKLNEETVRYLDIAKRGVDRLARLVNDILSLSKLESSVAALPLEMRQIGPIIQEAAATQRLVAEQKGLYLKTELSPDLPQVMLNADKMHQVLNNLLNNSVKFTKEGGVTVISRMGREAGFIEVCVKDTGPGIAKEDIEKLFQKFRQLANSDSQVRGSGLGLAICKEVIARHQGSIWVESEVGQGSSFIFKLPVVAKGA
jgi:signal transduction histidine kinase